MIVRHPKALWRHTLRGTMVLAPDAHEPQLLVPPGDAVWDALAAPISEADLITQLATAFDQTPTTIQRDLAPLIEQMRSSGLVIDTADPNLGASRPPPRGCR